MVRKLEKVDTDSRELIWNLKTDNYLPVASGVYIYHLTAFKPGTKEEVATKVGKMIIFVEEERLNTY